MLLLSTSLHLASINDVKVKFNRNHIWYSLLNSLYKKYNFRISHNSENWKNYVAVLLTYLWNAPSYYGCITNSVDEHGSKLTNRRCRGWGAMTSNWLSSSSSSSSSAAAAVVLTDESTTTGCSLSFAFHILCMSLSGTTMSVWYGGVCPRKYV